MPVQKRWPGLGGLACGGAAATAALLIAVGEAEAASAQQHALRDGCRNFYSEQKQKSLYLTCLSGAAPRSRDALVIGCYNRYRYQPARYRACVGR